MRILCNHEYALSSIFSYRSKRENKRYHEIVLVCDKCHKHKRLVTFSTHGNTTIDFRTTAELDNLYEICKNMTDDDLTELLKKSKSYEEQAFYVAVSDFFFNRDKKK